MYSLFLSLLQSGSSLRWAGFVVEIAVWALIGLGTVTWFDLQINWDEGTVSSRTGVCVRVSYQL